MVYKISRLVCTFSSKIHSHANPSLTLGKLLNSTKFLSNSLNDNGSSCKRYSTGSPTNMTKTAETFVNGVEGRPLYLNAQPTTSLNSTSFYGHRHPRTHAYGWERETAIEKAREDVADLMGIHSKSSVMSPLLQFSLMTPPNFIRRTPIGVPINSRIIPIAYEDKPSDKSMEDPLSIVNNIIIEDAPDATKTQIEKQAARLVVQRRLKMNKHKLKKLRRKMRVVWERRKMEREVKKEKAFLDMCLAKVKEAQRFDAKQHVAMLIAKAKEKPLPLRYKGRRMPEWWIKEQVAKGVIKL